MEGKKGEIELRSDEGYERRERGRAMGERQTNRNRDKQTNKQTNKQTGTVFVALYFQKGMRYFGTSLVNHRRRSSHFYITRY